jgi:hypothetical protein
MKISMSIYVFVHGLGVGVLEEELGRKIECHGDRDGQDDDSSCRKTHHFEYQGKRCSHRAMAND